MIKGKRSVNREDKTEIINLLISNSMNKNLLENLLGERYEITSTPEADFASYYLIIMDTRNFERHKAKIKKFKLDEHSFTPVMCLREEEEMALQDLFRLVEDVINLPVPQTLLLARVQTLIRNKKLWEKHRVLQDRYKNIFNYINDMVFLVDINNKGSINFSISETNETLLDQLQYRESDLKNSSPKKFMSEEDINELIRILENKEEVLFATEFQTRRGEIVPVEINARKVQIHNKRQILCTARDITEKKKREERINYLLFHDDLTDLYNRRFFEEEIKRLNTERQLPMSIFIIDVNGMKLVNDSYGHKAGDQLLCKTAELLRKTFRQEDIIARWGGDEFSVLLPQTDESQAENILARIKNECDATREDKLPVSLGVGYEVKQNIERDIFDVINKADSEMYKDKLTAQKSATNKIVKSLLSTLKAKSTETEAHTNRLAVLAIRLGEKIGLSNNQLNNLSLLATLHDIGKVNISEDILNKPGDLNDDEWERIKEHPRIGYKIALSSDDFSSVADEILAHHERWDGGGYPEGLKKDGIPLLARIISIVDAYDVMVNGRPYKESMSKSQALNELKSCAGTQFDPELVEEFVQMVRQEAI